MMEYILTSLTNLPNHPQLVFPISFSKTKQHKILPSFLSFSSSKTMLKLKPHFSIHNCKWVLATIIFQLLILIFLNHHSSTPPPPISTHLQLNLTQTTQLQNKTNNKLKRPICPLGKIYVYNLPPSLNQDLLTNCHDLDPWSSRCNAVSNGGFGPPATGLNKLIPLNILHSWYWTDMFSLEVIFHNKIVNYECRTLELDEANAFYIPFYVGLSVGKYLWYNYTSKDRDRLSVEMLEWVERQEGWRRSNGSDHFIVLGRLTWDFRRLTDRDSEWGTSFVYMPLMRNVLRLSIERSQWDPLEVSVPYPTAFHPKGVKEVKEWQDFIRKRKRSSLFSFVGGTRKKIKNDFRALIMSYSKNESRSPDIAHVVDCRIERCYDGAPEILEAFLNSHFCLQPKGDGYTRRSQFDCMLAGGIPVYFWRGSFTDQYEWHMPEDGGSYSVFIDRNDVRNGTIIIREVLEKYSREKVEKMRETIIDTIMPKFIYSMSGAGDIQDAFDLAMEGVLRRFNRQKTASLEK